MSWLSRLLGGKSDGSMKPQRLDYLNEALALERQGDFDAALTSYRLALRDHPNDPRILQNMAIAFSRTGRLNEAVSAYRRALGAYDVKLRATQLLARARPEESAFEPLVTAEPGQPVRTVDSDRSGIASRP